MSAIDLNAIENAVKHYLSPEEPSVLECCRRFGVSEGTLRRVLKSKGFMIRSAAEQKRQRVADHFAVGGDLADKLADAQPSAKDIDDAADVDINDMERALEVARLCIKRLKTLIPHAIEARDVKAIADANEKAMLTIRKIRGLDAPMDFTDWSDEELAYLSKTGHLPSGRR